MSLLLISVLLCTSTFQISATLPHSHNSNAKDSKIADLARNVSEMECGIREVALNFSQQIINRYNDRIYDALQLNECKTMHGQSNRDYHQTNPVLNTQFNKYLHNIKTIAASAAVNVTEFFVDINNGNDNNTGSKSNPFAHIKRAQNEIRNVKSPNTQFIVYIRKGTYFEGMFSFNTNDNGLSQSHPTIYTSYNNESVIISGGAQIQSVHFTQYNINKNIMYAQLQKQSYAFDQLFINNTHRLIRARSPNGNPEIDIQPKGYAYAIGPYNGQQPYTHNGQFISITNPSRNSSIYPWFGKDNDPRGGGEAYHNNGDAQRFIDNKGFWNGTTPAGIKYDIHAEEGHKLSLNNSFNKGMIANVFHDALWANWLYLIDEIKSENGEIGFNYGGFQEGRGGRMGSYKWVQPFYVENDMQLLDDFGEWYFNNNTNYLYLNPNKSDEIFMKNIKNVKYDNNGNFVSFDLDIQFGTNYRILDIVGDSSQNAVSHILFNGIMFTHTLRTQLLGYEVPSGGDWSIHRGGAVFLQNTKNIGLISCTFLRNGGNDIFLSDYNYNINITGNNFLYSADSSIAIVGRVDLIDGFSDNNRNYSNAVYIDSNYMENIGVFGKQTSALFTSVAGGVSFTNNVAHSGPRAGINLNDGFYGSKIIDNNLIFNWVRETQDHGPINTWDRVEYLFPDANGQKTNIAQWNRINHNFIYNGPNGNAGSGNLFPAVDNDDGSRMYDITNNVFVYGGAKNYLGDDKIWINNLIVFPSHWPGGGDCITAWSGLYHIFEDNQCISNYGNPLYYGACNPNNFQQSSKEMPFGANNSLFTPNAKFVFSCGNAQWTLKELQAKGWELGTTVSDIPSSQQIVTMVKNKIM
eukprot:334094_1